MKTFSFTIAWDDNDTDQGEYGATVRAIDYEGAERAVRDLMRASHQTNYGAEGDEHVQENGQFGGRVIEACEGAIWKASELEQALHRLIKVELYPADNAERLSAFAAAAELLDNLDK